jgi:hypothetical protein
MRSSLLASVDANKLDNTLHAIAWLVDALGYKPQRVGSIPDIIEFLFDLIFLTALWPWG